MKRLYEVIEAIEHHKEYLFVAWPLVNGQFGIDVLDYEHEERLDGGIFDNVDQAIEWLNENYVR
ncbi:hypothetical protein MAR005P1_00095 [Escherichia virus vB_Eco_mar005P1]|uniref:Uncharacterized protein n=5 Tax=Mosigvirus TaxID=1913652 RepID=A0A6B9WUJ1_9CAUD|nr:hypothetical protein APCEc01_077 [Escherichia phage APCEc01]YP_010076304.1 hypothetical protein KMC32_gp193 [Shigella phage JK45]AYN56648.1 hypothetical protein DPMPNEAM_00219 [Escherichia phage p000y]QBO65364.1 hypothetical protein G53_00227 [Escherichia phage vB_EcoM_G53]QEG06340.1 hypothetical protein JK42_00222 [Shigella phage JK42]QHR68366.1 hypothetical protein moha_233 [Escherichia phage moha]VCU43291.1 hypothetical protein MAR007P3_00145 [Escherichia virus vB_Eco_mar005P1]